MSLQTYRGYFAIMLYLSLRASNKFESEDSDNKKPAFK